VTRATPARRAGCAALVAGLVTLSSPAGAQARTVANLVVGDAVMVVQVAADKQVYIGIGTGAHTSALTASAAAVDQFVAETQAIVRFGTRPLPPHLLDRPELQESDSSGQALSVTRHVERIHRTPELSYHFFVSERRLTGYAVPATLAETKAILQALHQAARLASGPPAPRPRKGKPPSAAKQP